MTAMNLNLTYNSIPSASMSRLLGLVSVIFFMPFVSAQRFNDGNRNDGVSNTERIVVGVVVCECIFLLLCTFLSAHWMYLL
jgi:hypothetical protein